MASAARVAQPTPSVATRRADRRACLPRRRFIAAGEAYLGARAFTATDQARLAESSMRTQNPARRPTAELTSLHVRYKNALRAFLPGGVTRPAEVADLGPSVVARTRSTLVAQTELARAIITDVERLATRSRGARTVYERLREDARDQTICNAITSGEVKVELSVIETLYSNSN